MKDLMKIIRTSEENFYILTGIPASGKTTSL